MKTRKVSTAGLCSTRLHKRALASILLCLTAGCASTQPERLTDFCKPVLPEAFEPPGENPSRAAQRHQAAQKFALYAIMSSNVYMRDSERWDDAWMITLPAGWHEVCDPREKVRVPRASRSVPHKPMSDDADPLKEGESWVCLPEDLGYGFQAQTYTKGEGKNITEIVSHFAEPQARRIGGSAIFSTINMSLRTYTFARCCDS